MNNYTILVNESHPLPDSFAAEDLVDVMQMTPRHFFVFRSIWLNRECFEAANRMFARAEKDGFDSFILQSGHRTREYQEGLYENCMTGMVAKPGCSEHETGLAMDLGCPGGLDQHSPYYKWLTENAADFGFILRYPSGREHITGIPFESWHWRYVGVEAAGRMRAEGLTLEEYADPSIVRPDPYDLGFIFMSIFGPKMKGHWQEWPKIDLDALREVNPDVVGWIYMEKTPINYPVLYHKEFPGYYLNHNFSGQASAHGGIEMLRLPEDGIFIMSGHHMKDCSMFMKLIEILEQGSFAVHPDIFLNYEGTVYQATWFAAIKKTYQDRIPLPKKNDPEDRLRWLKRLKEDSLIASDLMPAVTDQILICSTCTRENDGNLVVFGVMK